MDSTSTLPRISAHKNGHIELLPLDSDIAKVAGIHGAPQAAMVNCKALRRPRTSAPRTLGELPKQNFRKRPKTAYGSRKGGLQDALSHLYEPKEPRVRKPSGAYAMLSAGQKPRPRSTIKKSKVADPDQLTIDVDSPAKCTRSCKPKGTVALEVRENQKRPRSVPDEKLLAIKSALKVKKAPTPIPISSPELSVVKEENENLTSISFELLTSEEAEYEEIFCEARRVVKQRLAVYDQTYNGILPSFVELGNKKFPTAYKSLYPEEYVKCECLYLCEFCLTYMKSVEVLIKHYEKCPWHCPPGKEVYHDTIDIVHEEAGPVTRELIVYESDGQQWPQYCTNLCLMGKLFVESKILCYDVEAFLFYVVCYHDQFGDHLVGYFSKDKSGAPNSFNLCCLMVLPPYRKGGYGRFLIGFSYILSQIHGQPGTPERPLSELGEKAYHSYWVSAILTYFLRLRNQPPATCSLQTICLATGMLPVDVDGILRELEFLVSTKKRGEEQLVVDEIILDEFAEKQAQNSKVIPVRREKLTGTPIRQSLVSPPPCRRRITGVNR